MLTLLCIVFLYFLPTFVARHRHNFAGIFLFNFFLGWTFVGWFIALIWACSSEPLVPVIYAAQVPAYAYAAGHGGGARFCSGCGALAKPDGRYCAVCGRAH